MRWVASRGRFVPIRGGGTRLSALMTRAPAKESSPPPPSDSSSWLRRQLIRWPARVPLPRLGSGGIVLVRCIDLVLWPLRECRQGVKAAFDFTPPAGGTPARPQPIPVQREEPAVAAATPDALAVVEAALAALPDKGHARLPEDINALAHLLGPTPPTSDFAVADLIRDCFASLGEEAGQSRALYAVALRLGGRFGLPSRAPLATTLAWRMLDPALFEDEMAAQLHAIGAFITNWQKTQHSFLHLEFSEIDLIEFLFEAQNPLRNSAIMVDVMSFKALSNRRLGILRRIPHRIRKAHADLTAQDPAMAVTTIQAMRDFLDTIVGSHGYGPIIAAATGALEEIDKLLEKMQPPPAPPEDTGEAQPLARIIPIKRPASEVAEPPAAIPEASLPPPMPAIVSPPPPLPSVMPAFALDRLSAAPPSPAVSALGHPRRMAMPIGVAAPLPPPRAITAAMPPAGLLGPAALPRLPKLRAPATDLPPLPTTPAAKPLPAATGRVSIALPSRPAAPSPAFTPPPPRLAPAPPPAIAGATVTTLNVVPKRPRRLPITQANKRQAVLKVLRGEAAADVAQSLGVAPAKLEDWVDTFIAAGAGALSPPPRKKAELTTTEELRGKLAEVLATAQSIERAMDAHLPRRPPVLLPPSDQAPDRTGKRPRNTRG